MAGTPSDEGRKKSLRHKAQTLCLFTKDQRTLLTQRI